MAGGIVTQFCLKGIWFRRSNCKADRMGRNVQTGHVQPVRQPWSSSKFMEGSRAIILLNPVTWQPNLRTATWFMAHSWDPTIKLFLCMCMCVYSLAKSFVDCRIGALAERFQLNIRLLLAKWWVALWRDKKRQNAVISRRLCNLMSIHAANNSYKSQDKLC